MLFEHANRAMRAAGGRLRVVAGGRERWVGAAGGRQHVAGERGLGAKLVRGWGAAAGAKLKILNLRAMYICLVVL